MFMKSNPVKKRSRSWLCLILAALIMLPALTLNPAPAAASVPARFHPAIIEINPNTNQIYVLNDGSYDANDEGTVTVIDGTDNSAATVDVGSAPQSMALNPITNKLYVANRYSDTVTVIDGADNTTVTVPVGHEPLDIEVNPTTNKIYIANQYSDTVTVIDGNTDTLSATVPVGDLPQYIAVNPDTNKIYVVNREDRENSLMVIDGNTDTVSATVDVGLNAVLVAINQVTNKIYVHNYNDYDIRVVDGDTDTLIDTIASTGPTIPRVMVVNPVTNKIYVLRTHYNSTNPYYDLGQISVEEINAANNESRIRYAGSALGSTLFGLAVNPETSKVYITNTADDTMTVFDFSGGSVSTATVNVGIGRDAPAAVAVNPETNRVYVANWGTCDVTVFDGTDNSIIPTNAPAIDPAEVNFYPAAPADISTDIAWGTTATSVTEVVYTASVTDAVYSDSLILDTDYGIADDILTIPEEFFLGLNLTDGDEVDFDIHFNNDVSTIRTLNVNIEEGLPPVTYTVTYDGNGAAGVGPTESDKVEGATFAAAANTFTAPGGKRFKQWNTAADDSGTPYAAGATVTMPAGDLTLYAIWKNRSSGGGGNGGSGGDSTPTPAQTVSRTQDPTVAVIGSGAVNKTTTTAPDGKITERFTIQSAATTQITQAKQEGKTSVEFSIPGSQSAVTDVSIPSAVLGSASGMNISPNATLELPAALVEALAAAGKDLQLTVERGGEVAPPEGGAVVGLTTEINTDITGTTQVTIPLEGITIPTGPAERESFLNSLAVFTYHSDGETELINAEIIYDASGNPVSISFPADKFSTFAVVKLEKRTVTLAVGSAAGSLNGLAVALDAPAYVDASAGRTMVPLRVISEALGSKVEWLPDTRQVRIKDGMKEIILTLDSTDVLINGIKTQTDCAPVLVPPGRTFLPLRFISETLGAEVAYDTVTREISIVRNYSIK